MCLVRGKWRGCEPDTHLEKVSLREYLHIVEERGGLDVEAPARLEKWRSQVNMKLKAMRWLLNIRFYEGGYKLLRARRTWRKDFLMVPIPPANPPVYAFNQLITRNHLREWLNYGEPGFTLSGDFGRLWLEKCDYRRTAGFLLLPEPEILYRKMLQAFCQDSKFAQACAREKITEDDCESMVSSPRYAAPLLQATAERIGWMSFAADWLPAQF